MTSESIGLCAAAPSKGGEANKAISQLTAEVCIGPDRQTLV